MTRAVSGKKICPVPLRPKRVAIAMQIGGQDEPTTMTNDRPKTPRVSFDYCTGCRWGLRAAWMAQELLVTFEKELGEVALRPSSEGGTFNIWIDGHLLWCRQQQVHGGFPEMKDIKQQIRDLIEPKMSLGHSDRK